MRFYVRAAIGSHNVSINEINPPIWIGELLPVKNGGKTKELYWQTYTYKSNDKSIVEENWENPSYFNNEYIVFIGGHVFYRNTESETYAKYVPSPTEVLDILLHHRDNHYKIIKGNYHIVLYNKLTCTIEIYSSPLSLYPVWYTIQDDDLIITNIMEVLLREKRNLSISEKGLVEFSLFDHSLGSNTIYKDIFQLCGGMKVSVSASGISEKQIYDIRQWISRAPESRSQSLKTIDYSLRKHISQYTYNIKKFNISLTGGFDGRLNFSYINDRDYHKLQAFSYGMKDSLQIRIPELISQKLQFNYKKILLDSDFEEKYADLGMSSIIYSGGVTPFIRANYPYAYKIASEFSRNCILGQCDMIRPLYTNPAGAIFNEFSHTLFFKKSFSDFYSICRPMIDKGFLNQAYYNRELLEEIYISLQEKYILPYPELSVQERYYIFLMKESMVKFWQTECHIVDLFVNDFISFSDLDYIETLSSSAYFGLYKGIFASNQFKRRRGLDLYADLMFFNNKNLNNIITDRFFKPKWIRRPPFGYLAIVIGKARANIRKSKIANDTFAGSNWSKKFYDKFDAKINMGNKYFDLKNLRNNKPYLDNNTYRYDRHISLKLWLQFIGLD